MDHRDKAQRRSKRGRESRWITLGLAVVLLFAAVPAQAAIPARRAPLDPEFVAFQEALAAMALPREATEDGHGLGLIPDPVDLSHMTGLVPRGFADRASRGFPATYDLRTLGRVTAVRDQGDCGSCWSFAGLASLESWLLTGPAETWNFSENNLKECHGFDWGACAGGNSSMVTAYLARRSGPVKETDDPYRDYPVGCTSGLTVQKLVRDVLYFPDRSGSLDNDTLKQAITTYGAISTDLYWVSGSYKASTRAYYYSGASGANHAVDLVGWDDAYSRTNFASAPAGDGAWIVRNSWGSGWGDGGYFRVSYYDVRIGQGNVAFVNAVAPDETTLYQYDPLGWITNWGYGSTTAWGANAFTASTAGEIRSVGTYASTVNTGYQIQIKNSLSGATLATKTGTWPLAGYHTVDLDTPIAVAAGQSFVVVVRYTTPAYYYPIPAECYQAGYSSGAAAGAGQSYISEDGLSWTDITTAWWGDSTCNFCIKAMVGPAAAPPSEDPVAYWRFNESSGATALDSAGTNDGTVTGATRVGGSPDSTTALSFSGSGQYVSVPSSAWLNFSSTFTVEAWIRPDVTAGYKAIVVKRGGVSEPQYGLWLNGNRLYCQVRNSGWTSTANLTGNTVLAAGNWTHVALRRDAAGVVTLWVDGVQQTATGTVAGAVSPPQALYIGRSNGSPEDFDGTIDEVRIHNRALDPGEFNLLPSSPAPVPPALVTNFTASDGADAQSVLAWTNPGDSDLAQVVVLRKLGSYPTSHTDGTNVYDNASPTPGAPVSTTNTGLTNTTTYYYAVFSRDTASNWNDTVTAGSNADTATPSAAASGPIAYWRFNEGCSSTALDSAGTNHGTITGAVRVTGSPDGTSALLFSGPGQYVSVPTGASLSFAGAFTLEAWINPAALSGYHAIVTKQGSSGEAVYGLWTRDDKLYGQVYNSNASSTAVVLGNTTLTAGVWTHVALRRDAAGEVSLWVNGVKETATGTVTGDVNPPGALYIGRYSTSSAEDWNGQLDEVRLHGRSLAPAEFNLLPSSPAPVPPALVTNFTASDGADAQSVLTWTNPADSDLAQVVVLRKLGSYPASHTDGTNVYDNSSPTACAPVSTTNTGLTNNTTYYYAVFSRDTASNWNDTVTAGSNADTATPSAAASGPIAYWRFNEGSGSTTADASGNGNNGAIAGATWSSGSPDATTALSFSGSGQYVSVPSSAWLNFSSTFTVEAWIRPDVTAGYKAIVVKRGGVSEPQYGLWLNGNRLYCQVRNSGWTSTANLTGNTVLAAGNWTHVALRRDAAGVVTLWVDGVQQTATGTVAGAVSPPQALYIGRSNGSPEDFDGTIDEVRIHNRALDPGEFNLLPSSPAPVPPALVTNFTASDGADAQSVLTWTNPADSDLAQVVVLRKLGSYPTSHTDGTNVYDNASPTPGAPVSTTNTGLTNTTTYYYAVFSRDTASNWNDTVTAGSNADTATPSAAASGPVAYWRFNEGSGSTTADASGNGNNGALAGATWSSGSPDSTTALSFSGSGQYVSVPSSAWLNFSSAFTVEAWIRPDVTAGYKAIVVKRGGVSEPQYGLWLNGNRLYCQVRNSGWTSTANLTGNTVLAAGNWTHVALRRDAAGVVTLWVDGVQQTATGTVAGAVSPPQALYIGRSNGSPEDFDGTIDEVRIHNRALDPGELNLVPAGATPPALVTNFTASDGADAQSVLTWTNPADSDLAQVVVLRKLGSYPTSHTDGTNVYDNASPTPGAPVSTTNTGLTNTTTYYYAVFSRDTASNWNDTVTAGSNADTATPSAAASGPVAYWRFNEGSGSTTADASGNGNNGALAGATWSSGSPDSTTALSFSGSGQYVSVPSSAWLNFSSAFTVEAWIRPDVTAGYKAIVVKRGGVSEPQYGLWLNGNRLYCQVRNSGWTSTANLTGNTVLAAGTWTHVALRRDAAGVVTLWVDGVQQTATGTVAGAVSPPQALYIGRSNGSPEDFDGTIDEVRIHNRALDSTEFNLFPSSSPSMLDSISERPTATAWPNPVRIFPVTFAASRFASSALAVEVYGLSGELVWESGWWPGSTFEWDGRQLDGSLVANGVYLYIVRTRGESEALLSSTRAAKLFVLCP